MRATALIMLTACTGEPIVNEPEFPTTLHIVDGLSAADEEAMVEGGERWAKASGVATFNRVERGGFGCGVYAMPAGSIKPGARGEAAVMTDCKAFVMLSAELPNQERRVNVACHEIGHLRRRDGSHNPDKRSVMHSPAGGEILREDLP